MHKPNIWTFGQCKDLGAQFTIVHGDYPGIDVDVGEGKLIMYNAHEVAEHVEHSPNDPYILIDNDTVDLGSLFVEDGYRGQLAYWGLVKVDGVWYECDFVSEGMAYPIEIDDEAVERIVREVEEEDNTDEEDED